MRNELGQFVKGSEMEHPRWKGDDVGIDALHKWVIKYKGRPSVCFSCGSEDSKRYEWANVSGEYKRDLDDFVRLCHLCHMKFDGISEKIWVRRRLNANYNSG